MTLDINWTMLPFALRVYMIMLWLTFLLMGLKPIWYVCNCYKSQVDGFAFRNDLSGQDVVCEQVESSDSLRLLSLETTMETYVSCRVLSRYKRRRQVQNTLELRNDVDRYLSDLCEVLNDQFDVLSWWILNAVKYRILSKIA